MKSLVSLFKQMSRPTTAAATPTAATTSVATVTAAKPGKTKKPQTIGDLIKLARKKRRQGKTLHFLAYLGEYCPETGVPFFKLMVDCETKELCVEQVEWEEAREMLRA